MKRVPVEIAAAAACNEYGTVSVLKLYVRCTDGTLWSLDERYGGREWQRLPDLPDAEDAK